MRREIKTHHKTFPTVLNLTFFFALYNGVKPRCEAPGKRNDTTISKSLKPSLFVANVEDPRSELLSSNKRERRLGDALSRSQANQQTHWEKEKRGRTYSKVDLRSLSFNSNIKKIWRITNTISHQARFSSAKLSMSGTFKRKSLKWCRLAKLARLARCLSLCLLGSTFGRCVQFSPFSTRDRASKLFVGYTTKALLVFFLFFLRPLCLKTLSEFSSFLVLHATIGQTGRKVLVPGPQKSVVEVDIRSFFFDRWSVLGNGGSSKSVKKHDFFRKREHFLLFWPCFSWCRMVTTAVFLDQPPPPTNKNRWLWWFLLGGAFLPWPGKNSLLFIVSAAVLVSLLEYIYQREVLFTPLRCIAACEMAWQAVSTWPNFDRRQCQKRFEAKLSVFPDNAARAWVWIWTL